MTTIIFAAQTTFTQKSSSSATGSSTVTSPTSPATSTPAVAPSQGSSTPIGAIVGGAVGGVALIALIAFGVWFMKSRNKKKAAAATAESQSMMAQNTGAGGPGAMGGPAAPMQSPYTTGAGGYAAGGYAPQQNTQYTGATHDGSQPMAAGYYQDPSKQGFQQVRLRLTPSRSVSRD